MRRAVFLLAIIVLLGAPAVWAQPIEDGGGSQPFMTEAPEAWGTSDATVYTVQPYECSTLYSTDVWQPYPGFTSRYIETPNGGFVCSVHLPTGANVYLMYLDSCDTSSSGSYT